MPRLAASAKPSFTPSPPELIAPAGNRDCARAAVENGADAVYFGLGATFNARNRAANFAPDELPELMSYLRRRGVKGYITLNTLVFPRELEEFERTVRFAVASGVDAILVQDFGAARLVRAICPEVPLHASTQMTLTSAECIRAAESLGIERVVLARELSVEDIARIHDAKRRATLGSAGASISQIQLEVFVHGAICVAYSGQCLTSESLGGRSANRGQCAQACRLAYELVSDGRRVDLGERKYLLSPRDLAAYDLVPRLIASGVSAMKIEGRLKTPEYVANITRYYRQAIDTAMAGRPVVFTSRQIEEMEVSFSRGFSHGWLDGADPKALVPGLGSSKQGVYLGEVRSVRPDRVAVELAAPVKRGDGVLFEPDRSEDTEQGGRVWGVLRNGRSIDEPVSTGVVELTFGHGAIDFGQVRPGRKLWKTDDPELARRLRKTYLGEVPRRRVALDLAVEAAVGKPLRIAGRAVSGAVCRLESPQTLEEARKHPLTAEVLAEQLGRLGGTAYELRNLEAKIVGRPMIPLSVLGKLRHELVEALDASLAEPPSRPMTPWSALEALRVELKGDAERERSEDSQQGHLATQLHVLCRSLEQLATILNDGAKSVLADFRDVGQYGEAVRMARAAGATILLATPRIQKPREAGLFRVLARQDADGILARNLAGLAFFAGVGMPVVADFSLNAANELSVQWLRRQGASRVTASYDLNRDELLDLVASAAPECLEVVMHQHVPMFHMEHCVFAATLSPGSRRERRG
ncbi:MAG: U32 family peptidase, partial [Pirellulales bacterium]